MPYFVYLFFNACLLNNKIVIKNNFNNQNITIIIILFLIYGFLINISIYAFYLLAPS